MMMIRKDIQGLRAIAVVAVLVFHFWPERLPGGYVGVDIFFVISGFLITSHLLRKPPISRKMLVDFWARRIRRLIPAATLVLFATVIASIVWLPETMLQKTVHEAAAAAVYGENWMLAASATDYLASEEAPSPIQHYWSLSIEEQYYLFWPIIIGAIFLLGRRFLTTNKLLAVGMGIIFAASLLYSVYLTDSNPAAAYFVTPTRVWELALGGIIALMATRVTMSARLAVPMAWSGVAMIIATVFLFTKQVPFPSYTALLPTIGTALIILAATDSMRWSPRRLLGMKTSQFIGDISYSIYLWHWPVVIIAPFALGGDYLTFAQKIVFVAIVVLLSYLTKIFVEDPVRGNRLLMKTNIRTYAYGIASILVVVVASLGIATVNQSQVALAQKTLESALTSNDPCLGAAALRNDGCAKSGDKMLVSPVAAKADRSILYGDNCVSRKPFDAKRKCTYGSKSGLKSIAMIGNSHTTHLFGALEETSKTNKWRLDTYVISDCYPVKNMLKFDTSEASRNCHEWSEWGTKSIVNGDYSVVVMSSSSAIDLDGVAKDDQFIAKKKAYGETIDTFTRAGKKVLIIRDVPGGGENAPDCLAKHNDDSRCSNKRSKVEKEDPLYSAALDRRSKDVLALNLNNRFCDEKTCYVVIGGLIVYFDGGHVTDTYMRSLVPDIEPALKKLASQ